MSHSITHKEREDDEDKYKKIYPSCLLLALDSEDPETIMRKKFLAKCRFRALARKVIENLYWLAQVEEVYEGDNVKKRVEQAMRAKSRKKNLLALTDKALLNKPVFERTDAEKRYIYRKIGGLKCFKRYPAHVKRKLAAATYFKYYGPNRVIVRQDQEAHALYFVVTGDVVVSVRIFDELLKQFVSVNVFVMHPGDMFGEVSLLHNIKRTATCTTSGHCEFLALMTEDFKDVLQKSLQKQWDEVKQAMSSFTYFDELDEVARREGCIVAKTKSFEPDETILGDGAGHTNFVYFVLSGRCQMIESLNMSCTEIVGKKFYTLYDPYSDGDEKTEDVDFDKKYFKTAEKHTSSNVTDRKSSEKNTSNIASTSKESKSKHENVTSKEDVNKFKSKEEVKSKEEIKSKEELKSTEASKRIDSVSKYDLTETTSRKGSKSNEELRRSFKKRASLQSYAAQSKSGSMDPIDLSKVLLQAKEDHLDRHSLRIGIPGNIHKKKISTYFMQVCIFNAGSTFGFGENMRDRRIVAMTRVDCLMLPLVWLLQKNTVNIWTRIRHYLEKKIPTKKQLFEEFVQQRRWLDWRNSLVKEIVSRSKTVNHTSIHDVPYFIRMKEMLDI